LTLPSTLSISRYNVAFAAGCQAKWNVFVDLYVKPSTGVAGVATEELELEELVLDMELELTLELMLEAMLELELALELTLETTLELELTLELTLETTLELELTLELEELAIELDEP
jgi:hypothetical protein